MLKYALLCPTLYEGDKMGALDLVDQLKQEDKFLYKRASKNMFDFWIPYIDKRLKAEEAQAQKAAPDPQS